jgi:hypothetical protein
VDTCRELREEAAICRDLAREIDDPASIAMFLDRAEQLEARAAAIESGACGQPEALALNGGHRRGGLDAANDASIRTYTSRTE